MRSILQLQAKVVMILKMITDDMIFKMLTDDMILKLMTDDMILKTMTDDMIISAVCFSLITRKVTTREPLKTIPVEVGQGPTE